MFGARKENLIFFYLRDSIRVAHASIVHPMEEESSQIQNLCTILSDKWKVSTFDSELVHRQFLDKVQENITGLTNELDALVKLEDRIHFFNNYNDFIQKIKTHKNQQVKIYLGQSDKSGLHLREYFIAGGSPANFQDRMPDVVYWCRKSGTSERDFVMKFATQHPEQKRNLVSKNGYQLINQSHNNLKNHHAKVLYCTMYRLFSLDLHNKSLLIVPGIHVIISFGLEWFKLNLRGV